MCPDCVALKSEMLTTIKNVHTDVYNHLRNLAQSMNGIKGAADQAVFGHRAHAKLFQDIADSTVHYTAGNNDIDWAFYHQAVMDDLAEASKAAKVAANQGLAKSALASLAKHDAWLLHKGADPAKGGTYDNVTVHRQLVSFYTDMLNGVDVSQSDIDESRAVLLQIEEDVEAFNNPTITEEANAESNEITT